MIRVKPITNMFSQIPSMPPVAPPKMKSSRIVRVPSAEEIEVYIDLDKIIYIEAPRFHVEHTVYECYIAYHINCSGQPAIPIMYRFKHDDMVQAKIYKPKIKLSKDDEEMCSVTFRRMKKNSSHEDWVPNPEYNPGVAKALGLHGSYGSIGAHPKVNDQGEIELLKKAREDYNNLLTMWKKYHDQI